MGAGEENDVSADGLPSKLDQSIPDNSSIAGSQSNLFGWLNRARGKSKQQPAGEEPKAEGPHDIAARVAPAKRDLSAPPGRPGRGRDEKKKASKKEESSARNLWSAILGAKPGAESKTTDSKGGLKPNKGNTFGMAMTSSSVNKSSKGNR